MNDHAAVFLDRDGVLNALVQDPVSGLPESPLSIDDVQLLDGVPAALARLQAAGFLLVSVTNQPAAAKERIDVATVLAINNAVLAAIRAAGVEFDGTRICLHHPEGTVPKLTGVCDCRKPEPGMLLDAAEELGIDLASSWMIGDSDADIGAGQAAGCRTILVEHPDSAHRRGGTTAEFIAADLEMAVSVLLGAGLTGTIAARHD